MVTKIKLTTSDGINIAANYLEPNNPKGYLVLAHMMPATKESWNDFMRGAEGAGYASLAFDLRGHGESDDGPEGYKKFNDAEHQSSLADVAAAVNWLRARGASDIYDIYLIGASIGANLVLKYLGQDPKIKSAVLLSPGLNYRGLESRPLIKKVADSQRVMLVGAKDDGRSSGNAAEMAKALFKDLPEKQGELLLYERGGHGTDLFKASEGPNLETEILKFISS